MNEGCKSGIRDPRIFFRYPPETKITQDVNDFLSQNRTSNDNGLLTYFYIGLTDEKLDPLYSIAKDLDKNHHLVLWHGRLIKEQEFHNSSAFWQYIWDRSPYWKHNDLGYYLTNGPLGV